MRALVVTPTYNERENLPALIERVKRSVPEGEILVVDDSSPDGTGSLVREIARSDPRVSLLDRKAREGLGPAYVAGFREGVRRGYDVLVQMDADLSHPPERIPALLEALRGADLALGSRYVEGGRVKNWGALRRLVSKGGSLYARTLLGLPIRDLTGGFKAWRREALVEIGLAGERSTRPIRSGGYTFQIETTWRAWLAGLRIREVPFVFTDRTRGHSKMSWGIFLEAVLLVWALRRERPR